ncbi:hypothetical protein BLA39750_01024 [Burkholderia lata]|uniref:Uncharacterized protein n=1 Tax=Burkholderia lata (strain ATCC 17760 / DSM 23089 / LMG 22485 / NCIMB 9086 / R18194 / 383) TaxID=482957 RepID=A0A6P2VHQ7_BURL3|nr:hypothetical protein [Burkholderia lata]VWC78477.1 hypothetical protein BLA39750_01024 [Burkholderia lata]
MNSFFPHTVDDKSLPPSRAERLLSLIAGASLLPVVVLQMFDVVPAQAMQEALLGRGMPSLETIGTAIDGLFAPLHGAAGIANPQIAGMVESASKGIAPAMYFGAMTLCLGSVAGSAMLAMRRNRKGLAGGMSDTRSW